MSSDSYYQPPDPNDDEVTCPRCADDRCEHDLRVCPECGDVECRFCDNRAVIFATDHPDWCDRCGLTGSCPDCDPVMPWERD